MKPSKSLTNHVCNAQKTISKDAWDKNKQNQIASRIILIKIKRIMDFSSRSDEEKVRYSYTVYKVRYK
ncbi:hypothetical protein PASm1_05110 [Pasteurella multocida]|nr:hypothetical protein PASm1_05110 [Pasteurella multocida]